MASYKYPNLLKLNDSQEFDRTHTPGDPAPYAGIFRCMVCGHEIGIAEGHTLPPQNHAQHPVGKPIWWKLVAFAVHNK